MLLSLAAVSLALAALLLWMLLRQRAIAEQRLKALVDLAQRVKVLDEELEMLSYTVSHELRAPVHVIHGFVDAMLSGEAGSVDSDARQYLDRVQRSAARMDQLMTDLIALSQLSREAPRYELVDVQATATRLALRLQQRHPGRFIQCDVRGTVDVEADSRLLEILLDSVMDNAAKFSPAPGPCRIEVHARGNGNVVVIQVADHGVGFPEELTPRLFRPFQRLHANGLFPGAGMGLATAARIVRLHGGTIEGRNRPGGGAVFEVRMPQQRLQVAAIAEMGEAG